MGMLALTRRVGEEVVIGDPASPLGVVRVVEIHGDKVRLAFDFPREMQVNRRELAEQKLAEARGETASKRSESGQASKTQPDKSQPSEKPSEEAEPATRYTNRSSAKRDDGLAEAG